MTRRSFLASTALPAVAPLSAAVPEGPPKRIAAVITTWFRRSHADVIVGKYLEGFHQNGKAPYPRSKIVSMYTAQVHEKDLTRIPTLVSILLTIGWPRTPLFMRVGKHSRR